MYKYDRVKNFGVGTAKNILVWTVKTLLERELPSQPVTSQDEERYWNWYEAWFDLRLSDAEPTPFFIDFVNRQVEAHANLTKPLNEQINTLNQQLATLNATIQKKDRELSQSRQQWNSRTVTERDKIQTALRDLVGKFNGFKEKLDSLLAKVSEISRNFS